MANDDHGSILEHPGDTLARTGTMRHTSPPLKFKPDDPVSSQAVADSLCRQIEPFMIGFLRLTLGPRDQDAAAAGSGALVTVGSVSGVLTAAHVLTNLPDRGKVGLVRFQRVAGMQRQTVEMEHTEKLVIGPTGTSQGPDLGFLRLPPDTVAALKATGNVFFNLSRRRDEVLSGAPGGPRFDGIAGVIAEWTVDLPDENPLFRLKGFHSLYGIGIVVREHEHDGFDFLDFETTYDEKCQPPSSFQGASGGSLWRVYLKEDKDGEFAIVEKKIFGVVFFESGIDNGKQIITCHGPRSVYGRLIDAIQSRWPS